MPYKDPEKQRAYLAYQTAYRESHKKEAATYRATHKEEATTYRAVHKKDTAIYQAAYNETHKKKVAMRNASYRTTHKKETAVYNAIYRVTHTKEMAAYNAIYRKKHKYKAVVSDRHAERMAIDIQYKLRHNLRGRIHAAIKSGYKAGSAVRDLGCSIDGLKSHLESKFTEGMTWDNWAFDGWHIDHIRPLASFDLTDRDQFLKACHYTNLQPLWASENFSKGARY